MGTPYNYVDMVPHIENIAEAARLRQLDYIVGIYRGGVIPAMSLAYKLNLPCKFLTWQIRDGIRDVSAIWPLCVDVHEGANILLVDDISDSGRTFSEITGKIHEHIATWRPGPPKGSIRTAALIVKQGTEFVPNYHGMVIPKDADWVDFWWEK